MHIHIYVYFKNDNPKLGARKKYWKNRKQSLGNRTSKQALQKNEDGEDKERERDERRDTNACAYRSLSVILEL